MESIRTQESPGTRESTGARWLGVGAVLAAIGASLCCVLPVVVVFAGFSSAAAGAIVRIVPPQFTCVSVAS